MNQLKTLIILCGFIYACDDSNDNITHENQLVDLSSKWTESIPESVGIKSEDLQGIVSKAQNIPELRSILVIKNGYIVSEDYFQETSVSTLFDTRSVTKSVLSLVVFQALERGIISSLDQKINLGESYPLVPPHDEISYRHLLSMTAGFQWDEWASDSYIEWFNSDDQVEFLLELGQEYEAGKQFNYNSAAVFLLGMALENELEESLEEFANKTLFSPIGIEQLAWEQIAGRPNGGAGLDLRSRDLARIGQLLLQNGISGDKQIISKTAIEEIKSNQIELNWSFGEISSLSYSNLWWTSTAPFTTIIAWGYGGQLVVIFPEKNMIVVTTTDWSHLNTQTEASMVEQKLIDLIFGEIAFL